MRETRVGKVIIQIPEIAESERTPTIDALMGVIGQLVTIVETQAERIEVLENEIAILKGQKPRPKIRPSTLSKNQEEEEEVNSSGKRPGSYKRSKTPGLKIHRQKIIKVKNVPAGSRFKGYRKWTVQDVILRTLNTCYLLEEWETPSGERLVGELPQELQGSHFGPQLQGYIVYQHAQLRVPQGLIHEHLLDIGVDISEGQINRILCGWGSELQPEREQILRAGLEVAPYVQADDTTARHKGQNGVCTQIGGEFFTFFASTESKSRENFLQLLQAGTACYLLNDASRDYLKKLGVKAHVLKGLPWGQEFPTSEAWQQFLQNRGTTHRARELTEAALIGGAIHHGLRPDLLILSDGAGQFDVFIHALCWYHAERPLLKLIPLTDQQRIELDQIHSEFWSLYQALKQYKLASSAHRKLLLNDRFDTLVSQQTSFHSLNLVLKRLQENKSELLRVLDYPQLPLHNNSSERDIREYVTKRKISAGTRSDAGRQSRDTLLTLKKTVRKLGLSFWNFLLDRSQRKNLIPPLADLLRQRYASAPAP